MEERALSGIYDRVLTLLGPNPADSDRALSALDLGTWSGQFATRLRDAGYRTIAADVTREPYQADLPFVLSDLNAPDFSQAFTKKFDVVTAIEVIEHLENPTSFLRNIADLLTPSGIAIITTPNMDNIPTRLKFLLNGRLRAMDAAAPEHLTPIFPDLLERMILPQAGLEIAQAESYPEKEFPLTPRKWLWPVFRIVGLFTKGEFLYGDSLIVVLRKTC